MAALERAELTLHPIADERAAAFFALGLRQAGKRPGLIATSGSAPCHWHPALVEAKASHLDLVLISADRPSDLRHRGAPQSADHRDLFRPQVETFIEFEAKKGAAELQRLGCLLADQEAGASLHINVPLAKPLTLQPAPSLETPLPTREPLSPPSLPHRALLEGSGLVIAGGRAHREDCVDELATFLQSTGSTLLAESASGLRHHPSLRAFQELTPPDATPSWVLRLGHWPTAPTWRRALVEWPDAGVPIFGLGREAQNNPLDPEAAALGGPVAAQLVALCPPANELRTYLGPVRPLSSPATDEEQLIQHLAGALPLDSIVVLGNSLSVRRFDEAVRPGHAPTDIYGNRGACGIDGQLAFSAGMAAGTGRKVTCLLGDLSLFHDLNSLRLIQESEVPICVVVINNDGGRIFDQLPAAKLIDPLDHERFFATPQHLDLCAAAALFGLPTRRVLPHQGPGLKAWLEDQAGSCFVEFDLRAR